MRAQPAQEPPTTRIAFWVFLAFLPVFLLVTRGHFQSTDEVAVFQQARSLWERGDLNVTRTINTFPGRGGNYYAVYGAGQSLLAAPLYAAGKWLDQALEHHPSVRDALKGRVLDGDPGVRWGGEVPIFTVSLFNAFVTALLCAMFFLVSLQLGASLRAALIGVAFFGLSSHSAGFASTFFQHPLETLLIVSCFYHLVRDMREPSAMRRAAAGACAGFALVVRIHTLVLLPALGLFLLWNAWQRTRPERGINRVTVGRVVMQCAPFVAMIALGCAVQVGFNYLKFEKLSYTGGYTGGTFGANLLLTWHAYFFSPGESIFVFTPLLVLIPYFWPPFYEKFRAEASCMLGVAFAYLLFYGKYDYWHGQWCFGPRYIVLIVPFLLLPFVTWWESSTLRQRGVATALGAIGVFVEVLSVAVNFSFVYHFEKYADFKPQWGYIFHPAASQPASHYRALMAGDYRVDMWLVNVYRTHGFGSMLGFALPLVALLVFALWGLRRSMTQRRPASPESAILLAPLPRR
jgi:hypothetical protein